MKILIIDDDPLVRIALKTLVNWEEHGFELAGEAEDGEKGLEMIERLHPDIVMLDIKMPKLDGIGVLKRLSAMEDRPRTLVLSSYDDFELVKEAIKLGADDYLLKLDSDFGNILEVMEKLANDILDSRRQKKESEQFSQQVQKNIHILRRNFFYNAINKFYSSEAEMAQSMKFLDIRLESDYLYCFLIKADKLRVMDGEHNENVPVLSYAVVNIAEEIVSGTLHSYCMEWNIGEFCVIAAPEDPHARIPVEELTTYGSRLVDMLREYLNLPAQVGVGEGGSGLKGMQEAHHNANNSFFNRFFKSDETVFLWNNTFVPHQSKEYLPVFGMKDELFEALNFRDAKRVGSMLENVANDLQTMGLSRGEVCNVVLKLYYMVSEYFEQNGADVKDVLRSRPWGYDDLIHIENVAAARDRVLSLKADLEQYLKNDAGGSGGSLAVAKQYINEHFSEEISLTDVANKVGLTPSYLSNLLKKETGKSYSEYLIDLRIEKAKALIRSTNHKIYEISEMVGYPNTFYFSRLFKRQTGKTPGEFKKQPV